MNPAQQAIPMAGPWITDLEVKVVEDATRNGWYGKEAYYYVETFQNEFAAWHGRKHGIMTPNCTSAIHLLLMGLGIGPGDEVIVPECTWIATAAPIKYVGATPVFCDIDARTWCLDAASAERAITPRTRVILAVDLYGNMPDMDALREVAARRGVHLIEDAAEALGSTYKGVRAGKFGVGSVFSFHRTKTLTTGEGGMLLLDDDRLYERCMFLRDHGRSKDIAYYNLEVTTKYMPFNLQAALGYAQFQRIDELIAKKRWLLEQYRKRFAGVPGIELNPEPPGGVNGVWCTALVWDRAYGLTKKEVMRRIEAQGHPARPFFYPLSSLPAYPGMEARYRPRNPVAYDVSDRGINLPCALILTEGQVDEVCTVVRKALGRAA